MNAPVTSSAPAPEAPHVRHERLYAGTILAAPEFLATHRVEPEDFGEPGFARIVEAALALHLRGARVSPVAVRAELERMGHERYARDHATFERLASEVELDIEPIAQRIRELGQLRRLELRATELLKAIRKRDLGAARELVGHMAIPDAGADTGSPVLSLGELLDIADSAIRQEGEQRERMIRLNLPTLAKFARLSPGSLMTVGAQTNVGKSTILLDELLGLAMRERDRVPSGLISVEDPEEDFGSKALGHLANVSPSAMWGERLSSTDLQLMAKARMERRDYPFSFCAVADRRLETVLSRMEFMARVRGARVIAVDYLQAIDGHRELPDIRQRTDATLGALISAAGRLKVALIVASQLSRPDKGNPFREPNLVDLKESGTIENRSQIVVLLWRKSDQPNAPIKGKIAKVKRQPAGVRFTLARHRGSAKFVEVDETAPNAGAFAPGYGPHDEEDDRGF